MNVKKICWNQRCERFHLFGWCPPRPRAAGPLIPPLSFNPWGNAETYLARNGCGGYPGDGHPGSGFFFFFLFLLVQIPWPRFFVRRLFLFGFRNLGSRKMPIRFPRQMEPLICRRESRLASRMIPQSYMFLLPKMTTNPQLHWVFSSGLNPALFSINNIFPDKNSRQWVGPFMTELSSYPDGGAAPPGDATRLLLQCQPGPKSGRRFPSSQPLVGVFGQPRKTPPVHPCAPPCAPRSPLFSSFSPPFFFFFASRSWGGSLLSLLFGPENPAGRATFRKTLRKPGGAPSGNLIAR